MPVKEQQVRAFPMALGGHAAAAAQTAAARGVWKMTGITLRLVNAALKNADIEARGQAKEALGDDAILGLLQKMIKQRQESIELYEKGGRAELAQQEREEAEIIAAYLPKQMSEAETDAAIAAAIAETGAAGMKDMGKVIGVLRGKYAGQMDFGKVSGQVKAKLSS
jgi:uncharacterized protein YqeY